MKEQYSKETKNYDVLQLLDTIFLGIFFLGVLTLMFYQYILNQQANSIFFYISVTSMGLFLLIGILRSYFMPLKKLDIEYFRNIITGISGGIVVWILSSTNYSSFKADFWLAANNLIIKMSIAIFIILIGYIICKKREK